MSSATPEFKCRHLDEAREAYATNSSRKPPVFGVSEGKRGGMLIFDLAEPSQVVETVEPFFLNVDAAVELIPVMNGDDLRKGLAKASQMAAIVQRGFSRDVYITLLPSQPVQWHWRTRASLILGGRWWPTAADHPYSN